MSTKLLYAVVASALLPASAIAELKPYGVNTDESVFAVIIYKGGVASALGHNHFIASEGYGAEVLADPDDLSRTSFSLTVPAAALVADSPELEKAWFDAIREAGLVKEEFPEQPESRREEITEHMLGKSQLNAEQFPTISARVTSIEEKPMTVDGVDYPYTAHLAFTVKNQTVDREAAADIRVVDGVLHVESVAEFRFTDFGIKPFKIAFGAVGNKDPFRVYVNFTAAPKAETER